MEKNSRLQKSKKNLLFAVINQMIIIFLTFFNRKIFIQLLGKEYLGVNGLFSSILSVLSLAELGINNTFLFFLYRPIYEKNLIRIRALVEYSKKLFRIIAIVIFLLGLLVIPFLSLLVDVSINLKVIYLYYIIYLLNSSFSYLAVYKSMLIDANQKNYITSILKLIIVVIQNILQIGVLFISHNYLLYLLIQLLCTVLYNLLVLKTADKLYTEIFISQKENIQEADKQEIWSVIKSTLVYKIGVVLMNNTDNILISAIVGTIMVGVYSNYVMVINVINTLITTGIKAITASLGEINSAGDMEYSNCVFKKLVFIFHFMTIFCSLCLFWCLNDFIFIWLGEKYLLGKFTVFTIVICFFVQHVISPVWIYRETMGLFLETKYLMIIAALINLLLSIVFGIKMGISGIIIATAMARILTTVWYEPTILYRKKFKKSVKEYYFLQGRYFLQSLLSTVCVHYILKDIAPSLRGLVFKVIVIGIVVFIVFFVCNMYSKEFSVIFRKKI